MPVGAQLLCGDLVCVASAALRLTSAKRSPDDLSLRPAVTTAYPHDLAAGSASDSLAQNEPTTEAHIAQDDLPHESMLAGNDADSG